MGAVRGCAAWAGRLTCVDKGAPHGRPGGWPTGLKLPAAASIVCLVWLCAQPGMLVCMPLLLAQQQRGGGDVCSARWVCKVGVGVRIGAMIHHNDDSLLRRRWVVHMRAGSGGAQQQIGMQHRAEHTLRVAQVFTRVHCR